MGSYRRILQVGRIRGLAQENLQRARNGVFYKRLWALVFNVYSNQYEWTINAPQFYDDVLAVAEIGVQGR